MVDMIQINDLKFSYPDGSAALRGVSLSVKHGAPHALTRIISLASVVIL